MEEMVLNNFMKYKFWNYLSEDSHWKVEQEKIIWIYHGCETFSEITILVDIFSWILQTETTTPSISKISKHSILCK